MGNEKIKPPIRKVEEVRARLASVGPRVLLAIEWVNHECPSCGGVEPIGVPDVHFDHRPDCALVAALRKAGLR